MKLNFLLLLISSYAAAAQTSPACVVYPTIASSDAWMTSTSRLSLKQQVAAVRQRVRCDVGVRGYKYEPGLCFMGVSAEGRLAYQTYQDKRKLAEAADPRPRGVVLFCHVDGQIVPADSVAQFERLVTQKLVKKIAFYQGSNPVIGIFGVQASEGMLMITTKNYKPVAKR